MRETIRPVASYMDHPTWVALSNYVIGPGTAALPFTERLARENGWSAAHAGRVVGEYRRFCFLASTCGHKVTPSDAVDQAWHLHLTYSRDYWQHFCPQVLGRELHHEPTEGGAGQNHLFFDQYAETLKSYETVFGHCAPIDLWPNAKRRLIDDPKARRVHPREGFVMTRTMAALLLCLCFACLLLVFLK